MAPLVVPTPLLLRYRVPLAMLCCGSLVTRTCHTRRPVCNTRCSVTGALSAQKRFASTVLSVAHLPTTTVTAEPPESTTAPVSPHSAAITAILKYPYSVVDTPESLSACAAVLRRATEVAVDVEALVTGDDANAQLGKLSLIQLCSDASPQIFLVDVLTLGVDAFRAALAPLFTSDHVRKFFFDCRRDVEALSCQAKIRARSVVDLQLYYTALQWRLRSVNRRSSMPYVLKAVTELDRKETDSAVHVAMTCGGRPVWDVRPLPAHFLDYAADDVRHTFILRTAFAAAAASSGGRGAASSSPSSSSSSSVWPASSSTPILEPVERLTEYYVAHYATGEPVHQETDPRPAEVNTALLERYIGPGGTCGFCGMRGHVESECFQKKQPQSGEPSEPGVRAHTPRVSQHPRYPHLLKCVFCGRLGHNEQNCFKKHPCKHCGGEHQSNFCRQQLRAAPFFDFQNKSAS